MESDQNLVARTSAVAPATFEQDREFVTFKVADQLFGLPVHIARDILAPKRLSPVPLAPEEVAGLLNLRGRIVTAVDIRKRLGLPARDGAVKLMTVVVDYGGEFYSLIVDEIGDVMPLKSACFEPNPVTLDERWRSVSSGIYRLDTQLMVLLDVQRLLKFDS